MWSDGFGTRFGLAYVDFKTQSERPSSCRLVPGKGRAQRSCLGQCSKSASGTKRTCKPR